MRITSATFPITQLAGAAVLFLGTSLPRTTDAWTPPPAPNDVPSDICRKSSSRSHDLVEGRSWSATILQSTRRDVLSTTVASSLAFLTAAAGATALPRPAWALVKGVAPPPPKRGPTTAGGGDKPRCTNVEECQALAEQRETDLRAREEAGPPPLMTAGGVKYRDVEEGRTDGPSAKTGDLVDVYFKVLKLGKRSYDGISGEGTVVFSRGYGLEDDEDKAGVKVFRTLVGSGSNIVALNEALVGMKVDGVRRFAILPQKGWERATAACDGGPGGAGAGGDLKTDYVVVPTATMVQQEACFDNSKLPFPSTYAQQRRMAQRFDQSLIMEVRLVDIQQGDKDMIL